MHYAIQNKVYYYLTWGVCHSPRLPKHSSKKVHPRPLPKHITYRLYKQLQHYNCCPSRPPFLMWQCCFRSCHKKIAASRHPMHHMMCWPGPAAGTRHPLATGFAGESGRQHHDLTLYTQCMHSSCIGSPVSGAPTPFPVNPHVCTPHLLHKVGTICHSWPPLAAKCKDPPWGIERPPHMVAAQTCKYLTTEASIAVQ
jgi:hypothetical protein